MAVHHGFRSSLGELREYADQLSRSLGEAADPHVAQAQLEQARQDFELREKQLQAQLRAETRARVEALEQAARGSEEAVDVKRQLDGVSAELVVSKAECVRLFRQTLGLEKEVRSAKSELYIQRELEAGRIQDALNEYKQQLLAERAKRAIKGLRRARGRKELEDGGVERLRQLAMKKRAGAKPKKERAK